MNATVYPIPSGEMTGASASPSGSRPSDGAQEASTLTGFDPSRIAVGDWIVIPGWRSAEVEHVERVTPKLVYAKQGGWRAFQRKRESVIASFADEQVARDLAQQLNGAAGQRDDRIRKAHLDFNERKSAAVAAYDKTAARLVASAIEARSDATGTGAAEGESAVAKPDAQ